MKFKNCKFCLKLILRIAPTKLVLRNMIPILADCRGNLSTILGDKMYSFCFQRIHYWFLILTYNHLQAEFQFFLIIHHFVLIFHHYVFAIERNFWHYYRTISTFLTKQWSLNMVNELIHTSQQQLVNKIECSQTFGHNF